MMSAFPQREIATTAIDGDIAEIAAMAEANARRPSPSMEFRLRTLAARGFTVDLQIKTETFGTHVGQVRYSIRLVKGDTYAGSGMTASGTGSTLDEATRAALAAGEAFLASPEPPAAIDGARHDLMPLPVITPRG